MEKMRLMRQIHHDLLAIVSLVIAIIALSYNTWRDETSEQHRNIRAAEFEMLKELSELQETIDYAYLRQDPQHGDLGKGLAHVLFIRDLASLAPEPVTSSSEALLLAWNGNSEKLASNKEAGAALSEQVLNTRRTVLESLRSLK